MTGSASGESVVVVVVVESGTEGTRYLGPTGLNQPIPNPSMLVKGFGEKPSSLG